MRRNNKQAGETRRERTCNGIRGKISSEKMRTASSAGRGNAENFTLAGGHYDIRGEKGYPSQPRRRLESARILRRPLRALRCPRYTVLCSFTRTLGVMPIITTTDPRWNGDRVTDIRGSRPVRAEVRDFERSIRAREAEGKDKGIVAVNDSLKC